MTVVLSIESELGAACSQVVNLTPQEAGELARDLTRLAEAARLKKLPQPLQRTIGRAVLGIAVTSGDFARDHKPTIAVWIDAAQSDGREVSIDVSLRDALRLGSYLESMAQRSTPSRAECLES